VVYDKTGGGDHQAVAEFLRVVGDILIEIFISDEVEREFVQDRFHDNFASIHKRVVDVIRGEK